VWIVRNTEGFSGPVANAMGPSLAQELASNLAAALPGSPEEFPQGAALFLLAGDEAQAVRLASALRLELGHRLQLAETEVCRFEWITDFPLYEMEEESGEIVFSHNPFSMPQGGLEALQDLPPLEVLAWQYDIFCNSIELSSGAVRNHRSDIMGRAFEMGGYPAERMQRLRQALSAS
jgi:aspartyl-tRNA synthetase